VPASFPHIRSRAESGPIAPGHRPTLHAQSLSDLACDPLRRRVACDVDSNEISAIKPYNHEAIQQFEADGRDHEQIHDGNVGSVVSQKSPPSLTLRSTSLDHVLGDTRRIARCRRFVLGTPAYFDRAGTPSTPSELSKHKTVVYLQGEGSVWSFRRETSELAVTVQSRLRVTAAEGVRAAVLADVGLTIASE
jgi:hypothetical protein